MKKLEYGRSMVEMLGVLAIIGVLSVGAIAGYQKAMMKYKLNKQAQQINSFLNIAIAYSGKFTTAEDTESVYITDYYTKLNLLPDGMKTGSSVNVYDVFNMQVGIFENYQIKQAGMLYVIMPDKLGQEICRNLVNIVKQYASDIAYFSIDKAVVDMPHESIASFKGNKKCSNLTSDKCLNNITLADVDNFCHHCDGMYCRIYTVWNW